jgi:hypothetical protein
VIADDQLYALLPKKERPESKLEAKPMQQD